MMGSDHYCLKWNNHWNNLLRVFNSLLRSETFVDVTLACEGRHINAHRLVLSACSPYFKDLLISHPDKHPIVILKDVRYTELVNLVQFIYNGEVSVEQHELPSFLCTARELQIKGLADDNIISSLPASLTLKAAKRKADSAYDSTNSIHLSSKSSDQPTNLSIRKKIRLSPKPVTTNGDDVIDLHHKTQNDSSSPPLVAAFGRTANELNTSTIEVSSVAGPSTVNEDKKESSSPADLSVKDEKPRICVIKQPKEKPPDGVNKISITERKMIPNLSEMVMEECESSVTNGTGSPRSSPATSLPSSFIGPPGSHSPMAFLHQTLAGMRYHPHLSLLQSELLDHQPKMSTSPSIQNPGLLPPNSILNFVDFLKVMGASGVPGLPPQSVLAGLGSQACVPAVMSPKTEASSPSSAVTPSSRSPSKDYELKPLTCSICARIMPSMQVLEEHVRIHEEEKPYTCDQCGQRYKYQSAFQRHKEQNHTAKLPGEKPYRCEVCGQCFKYHKSFTKHRSNHDLLDNFMKSEPQDVSLKSLHEAYLPSLLQKRFSQDYANIKEESKDSFDSKELTEDDSKDSKLSRAESENGDIKEEDMEFEEIVPDVPDEDEEYESACKVFFCTQCKTVFKELKDFEEHCKTSSECLPECLKEVSGEMSRGSSPQESPQQSPKAGTSSSNTKLSSSLVFSSPPGMVCKLYRGLSPSALTNSCDSSVLNLSKALFTLSGSASGIPASSRAPDPIRTNSLQSVANSLNPADEERPFKCQYCQKGFKGRENLKLHIRTHTGEKPYNCGVCGKAFGGRSDMNRHLRIHTGEKPYPCKVCGKKFARADYLSKHITTHLGMSFPKPVHSLQQSLQNLENMQNLQNAQNLPQSQHSPQTPPAHVLSSVQNLSPTFNQVSKD